MLSYIALGSNLGNPVQQVSTALRELDQLPGCEVLAHSPWYRSIAVGPGSQPDFINGVAQLITTRSPLRLLQALQSIEDAHGRERAERWGPRTLDLDILLFANECMVSDQLTIPHPRLQQRNFVLYPLFDLAPELALPCGTTIASLLARCPRQGLQRLSGDVSDPA